MALPNFTKKPLGPAAGVAGPGPEAGRGPAVGPPSSDPGGGRTPGAAPPAPALAVAPAVAAPAETVSPSRSDTSSGPTAETKMSSVMNWASGPPGSPGNTSTVGIRLRG